MKDIHMVVIGTSAGGVDALMKILPALKKPSKIAVVLVIHLPSDGKNLIPSIVGPHCQFRIKEAESGENIEKETIYVAPVNYHLCLEPNKTLSISSEPMVNFSRPSIDILFESAAFAYHKHTLGILLTGANEDGANGLKLIKEQNGMAIVQDPKTAEYSIMPEAALKKIKPDQVLDLVGIKNFLEELCQRDVYEN